MKNQPKQSIYEKKTCKNTKNHEKSTKTPFLFKNQWKMSKMTKNQPKQSIYAKHMQKCQKGWKSKQNNHFMKKTCKNAKNHKKFNQNSQFL